jgi:hypothetical protein
MVTLPMALTRLTRILLCLLFALAIRHAGAAENRFWLADQSDFGAKRGFYLAFENSSAGDAPCSLGTLKLIWGVADGKTWRFLSTPPGGWMYDHDYVVHATVDPQGAQMMLDGKPVAQASGGGLLPGPGPLLAGVIHNWAHGPADYWVVPSHVRLTGGPGKPLDFTFPALTPSLMVFESQAPRRVEGWTLGPTPSLTVDATFRLTRIPNDLHTPAPLVDRYGQIKAADWAGKTESDAMLRGDIADEDRRLKAWSAPAGDSDPYGGRRNAGWHGAATGFFQTVRHDGVWWLLTPVGNPCFYTSVCTAPALEWERTPITGREYLFADLPPRDGPTAPAWGGDSWGQDPGTQSLAFCTTNLIRKYGPDWQDAFRRQTARRIRAWGFSGLGKWSDSLPGIPSISVLNRAGVPTLAGHPDPFDPATQAKMKEVLAAQIIPHQKDPNVVAWSLGNEHDEIITAGETQTVLGKGRDVPAKRALVDEALTTLYQSDASKMAAAWGLPPTAATRDGLYGATPAHIPPVDIEALRRFYADRYYGLIEQTVKALDPDHLYAGFWIVPGWWENEEDWRLIARHCDVIGYDNYAFEFADERLTRLIHEAGKPVLCGEFSFPPEYGGTRGFGLYDAAWADDDQAAGRLYAHYVGDAARNPDCIGVAWFQYRDEPLTGRGPGHGPAAVYGEHYAFGLVDIADRPKWEMLTPMRRANLTAADTRMQMGRHP